MDAVAEKPKAQTPARKTQRHIRSVAVLGSGVMGSRIACHFAGIGVKVLLLDIVPRDLPENLKNDPAERNKIVNSSLQAALKGKPAAIYDTAFASRITTGNFEDNMKDIASVDWVFEAVIENLEIKKKVFAEVEKYRTPGTIVSTNTSGIPLHKMLEGRSEDFQKNFIGTHFFNPPRYLKLLEIIPTPKTDPALVEFMMEYGDKYLGKTTVLCKDTPAFIANRIGVMSVMSVYHLMNELGLSIEEVDALTGPISGKPKTATFRLGDLIGIDTLVKVANNAYQDCVNDESRDLFVVPDYINKMVEKGWTGDKAGQGFYKKVKTPDGKKEVYVIDPKTLEYKPLAKPKLEIVSAVKGVEDLRERLLLIHKATDKGAEFLKKLSAYVFQYCTNRIPEIADDLYKIDDAVKAGFAWELGPFESWDVIGVEEGVKYMESIGKKPNQWVYDMLAKGITSFYKVENGVRKYYDIQTKAYKAIPGREAFILLDNLRGQKPVWKNDGTTLHDIGDGVLNLEFHSKMNSLGPEVIEGINKAIDIAENEGWKGLVIANNGQNFSVGANLFMIVMMAVQQEWDELELAVRTFQNTMMRVRYSDIPVVVSPHNMTLGGGCELTLHADKVVAAAETYIGLVEVGVGLIPAGGGTKELVLRVSDSFRKGDVQLNRLQEAFVNIATAKVATSAYEAMHMDILKKDRDIVILNKDRAIAAAKQEVLRLYDLGYTRPIMREDITVLGRTALGGLYSGSYGFYFGNYATEHDYLIARKLAYVMTGGDLSGEQKVSEQYLLDLEREAFLSLCGEQKTIERMQHMLEKGKPLRN
ncbi:MAG: 3-hydroxyacyl-CoA dehydrogenase [Chitinophagales bacterium]|nr:MAG: 3-hydroxyacyl-CoA dehydrogenase [Chitinophagales bacterium]